MSKFTLFLVIFMLAILLTDIDTAVAQATETGTDAQECKEYGVDYQQTEGLTKEEITDRMDRALFESLNKYDDCLQQSQSGGAASANGASGSQGINGANGNAVGTEASSSTASAGIQGTEKTDTTDKSSSPTTAADAAENKQAQAQTQDKVLPNGKLPDDIPSSDNDTVLQQKVKEAAMYEPDPEKRAKLWNEYRKLKGLSQI